MRREQVTFTASRWKTWSSTHRPAGKSKTFWWNGGRNLICRFGKTLVPLAHNWAFESGFLRAWLGVDLAQTLFHGHARDAMLYALALNDKAAFMGLPAPFNKVGLGSLCKHFKIHNPNPHDALCDALAEAECYRAMLTMDLL